MSSDSDRRTRELGFSLLEVQLALAILVLGCGLISQLYLALGQQARLIYERQQALLIMHQIVAVLPYYPQHLAWLNASQSRLVSGPFKSCQVSQICSPQAMLAQHWLTWQQQLEGSIRPSQLGIACVRACQPGSRLKIQINWQASASDECAGRCVELHWVL